MKHLKQLAQKNGVLKAVPWSELSELASYMETVQVEAKQIVHREGNPLEYVHFPTTAVLSMIISTSDGSTVEIGTVGREGFTSVSAMLSNPHTRDPVALIRVMALIPGSVIRIKADVFDRMIHHNGTLWRSVRAYLNVLFMQLALSVSCNRLHSLEQRCARWLLGCLDKSQLEEVTVTQEMLGNILGVYRQSVIQVLAELESKGIIVCGRGTIRVNKRHTLSTVACECYPIAKSAVDNFLDAQSGDALSAFPDPAPPKS